MRATLLLDADDTLWENHAYFLRAIEAFLDLCEQRGHLRADAHGAFLAAERVRTRALGYGSRTFATSLVAALESLEGAAPAGLVAEILALGEWIFTHPIELFPGVFACVEELARRHDVRIVTKGNEEEQGSKLRRSGLLPLVAGVRILPEKDIRRYHQLVADWHLDAGRTWMVGNSPRSDINPAKAAGLHTVFVPHKTLWDLEREDWVVPPDLELARFSDLLLHF